MSTPLRQQSPASRPVSPERVASLWTSLRGHATHEAWTAQLAALYAEPRGPDVPRRLAALARMAPSVSAAPSSAALLMERALAAGHDGGSAFQKRRAEAHLEAWRGGGNGADTQHLTLAAEAWLLALRGLENASLSEAWLACANALSAAGQHNRALATIETVRNKFADGSASSALKSAAARLALGQYEGALGALADAQAAMHAGAASALTTADANLAAAVCHEMWGAETGSPASVSAAAALFSAALGERAAEALETAAPWLDAADRASRAALPALRAVFLEQAAERDRVYGRTPTAWLRLAKARRQAGQFGAADAALSRSLDVDPSKAEPLAVAVAWAGAEGCVRCRCRVSALPAP